MSPKACSPGPPLTQTNRVCGLQSGESEARRSDCRGDRTGRPRQPTRAYWVFGGSNGARVKSLVAVPVRQGSRFPPSSSGWRGGDLRVGPIAKNGERTLSAEDDVEDCGGLVVGTDVRVRLRRLQRRDPELAKG
jgi:hypothetical protein